MTTLNRKFVLLVILDGWGIAAPNPGNAISLANIPNMNRFMSSYPHTQLKASGQEVGLPRGEAGNTETGHLNLGAGRIVYQDLERINMSIADGSFFENKTFHEAIKHAKENNSNLHTMGLLGAGGVHSDIKHLYALVHFAKLNGLKGNLFLHLFTDGRDSPPTASKTYIHDLVEVLQKEGVGEIASIIGRYWAMDRDHRWDRTQRAYEALTKGKGIIAKDINAQIELSYAKGQTDEFIEPILISKDGVNPVTQIKDNDSIIFFNFRIDRPRQLTKAFILKNLTIANAQTDFDPYLVEYTKKHIDEEHSFTQVFDRGEPLKNLYFVTMTQYENIIVEAGAHVAYPPEIVNMPLGRLVSDAGLSQLRMSESEKERFVTFYFNGLREVSFQGEERLIIPSPKVATYDLKPEMSANEITDALLRKLSAGNEYSFVLINFANADMVGHTGNIEATKKACETIDACLGRLVNFIFAYGGAMLITADHGNAEEMISKSTGEMNTEHSSNPIPFIAISKDFVGKQISLQGGILADVAPTVLSLLGLQAPSDMTGRNLLEGV